MQRKVKKLSHVKPPMVQVDPVPADYFVASRSAPGTPRRVKAIIIGENAMIFHADRNGRGSNGSWTKASKLFKTSEEFLKAMKLVPAWRVRQEDVEEGFSRGGTNLTFVTKQGVECYGEIYLDEAKALKAALPHAKKHAEYRKNELAEATKSLKTLEARLRVLSAKKVRRA